MGSLYEKYDYEDPPQMDMLSLMCSGISSPALAQYFAQDLSEQVSKKKRVHMYIYIYIRRVSNKRTKQL
jgi:hypothetical protein